MSSPSPSGQEDTSLQVFRKFIKYDTNGKADASSVLSKECYQRWLATRRLVPEKPEESFRRVLTAHVRGTGGRKPFHQPEEEALLVQLKKRRVWPCFVDNPKTRVGIQGFRLPGYHESKNSSVSSEVDVQSDVSDPRSNSQSSFEVFSRFALPDEQGHSQILGRECFETWQRTRRQEVQNPKQAFRKTLIAHLSGRDGRRSFPKEIASLITAEIKRHRTWPCFQSSDRSRSLYNTSSFPSYSNHHPQSPKGDRRDSQSTTLSKEDIEALHDLFAKDFLPMSSEHTTVHSQTKRRIDTYLDQADTDLDVTRSKRLHYQNSFHCKDVIKDESLPPILFSDDPRSHFDHQWQTSDPFMEPSPLELFQDVTPEEVRAVKKLKQMAESVFKAHWAIVDPIHYVKAPSSWPRDVCGDVRLLRILRLCGGDLELSLVEIEAFLKWRREGKIEEIRNRLLADNWTYQDLYLLRSSNRFLPFFHKNVDGDIIDVLMLETGHRKHVTSPDMMPSLTTNLMLWEFRSIIIDRLSYSQKRIVMLKMIVDCPALKFKNGVQRRMIKKAMCWDDLKIWGSYLSELAWVGNKWHVGLLSRLYLFGSGCLFRLMSRIRDSEILEHHFGEVHFAVSEEEKKQILCQEVGPREKWPAFYSGAETPNFGNTISTTQLSSFR